MSVYIKTYKKCTRNNIMLVTYTPGNTGTNSVYHMTHYNPTIRKLTRRNISFAFIHSYPIQKQKHNASKLNLRIQLKLDIANRNVS